MPSLEGERLAYFLSQGGDEETSLFVMDVATGETIEGPIDRTRYCPLAWLPGGDTYYGRRLPADAVPEGEAAFHRRVWRHRVGTDPDGDIAGLRGGAGRRPSTTRSGCRSTAAGCWSGRRPGRRPATTCTSPTWPATGPSGRSRRGSTPRPTAGSGPTAACTSTPLDAPRFRIVVADPTRPEPAAWRDLVPESGDVLAGYALTDDALVVASSRHAVGQVAVHDRQTGAVRRRGRPAGTRVGARRVRPPRGRRRGLLGYTDFTTPPARAPPLPGRRERLELWMDAPGQVDLLDG